MGVRGLSTFIQRYHDKYKEKVYLHDCPIVIDGCNLMFFLYCEGRNALPSSTSGSTPKRRLSSGNKSPLSKASPLKRPHLFGGDYSTYAQNVREFFQHLKLCNITPIVLFDGAYDALKIKTALKRFSDSVKENVGDGSKNNFKGVTPGSSYSPVFMKAVFVEILHEQKVSHYQTENEADCTIAYIARKLGNCPILSSDSDFHMYVNAITLPLHTLKFRKVTPSKQIQKKSLPDEKESPLADKSSKMWILYSEYVSLSKLCSKEFNLNDTRFLPLAAVLLGNDWIGTGVFSHFHCSTTTVSRKSRILYILKWLGKQKSYERVLHAMLSTIQESQRKRTTDLVNQIVSIYQGLGGEEKVWEQLLETGNDIARFMPKDDNSTESAIIIGDLMKELSLNETLDFENLEISLNLDDIENIDDEAEEVDSDSEDFEINTTKDKKIKELPDWYLEAHRKCWFPTYLLKLARNRLVFLSPQVELSCIPSSHSVSIPIIQVIGGILLGTGETLTLVTRQKSQIDKVDVQTVSELKTYGPLPTIKEGSEDFRKKLPTESRIQIILETLGLHDTTLADFINQWPASLRIWIAALLYFIKNSKNNIQNMENKTAIPVALAILMSVIKNAVLNSSGGNVALDKDDTQMSENKFKISSLLSQSNPLNLSNLRKFYTKYEVVTDVSSRTFTKSYDITRAYNLSMYTCILFHLSQLNRLLGDPFRFPRLSYNLNNWFVYNLSSKISEEREDFNSTEANFGSLIASISGVEDMGIISSHILSHSIDVQSD